MATADPGTICQMARIGGGDPNIGYLVYQLQGLDIRLALAMNLVLVLLATHGKRMDAWWDILIDRIDLHRVAREEMDPNTYQRLVAIGERVPITLESDWTRTWLFAMFALNTTILIQVWVVPHVL